MRLKFGEFELDTISRRFWRGAVELVVEPKVFDCLALLISEAGQLVRTEVVRAALWPGVHVGDGALRRIINEARKALGDTAGAKTMIRTRRGLGYVFVPEVTRTSEHRQTPAASGWPFVGRDRELGKLRAWRGGLCFVSGEAGAGKSSLLARFAAEDGEAIWLVGRCRATLDAPAYWPFREIARQLAAHPLLRVRVGALADQHCGVELLLPELAGTARSAKLARTPSAETRFELCEAFASLLRSLAHTRPLRLAIEDLHWADDGSLALLDTVARAAHEMPLRVLGTYRPEAVASGSALSKLIARGSGRHGAISVHLGPLGETELAQLFAALRLPESAGRAAPRLLALSGGNALYLHELIQHQPLANPQPPSLNHIIGERLAGLPSASQTRVSEASVLGHDFAVSVLAAMGGADPSAVLLELEPALRAGLLQQNPLQPDRLQFNHALVGDALAACLDLPSRKRLHRAALEAMRRSGSSSELAHHAFEAGEQVSAAERKQLCETAGRELFESLAFDRAVVQLGRAARLAEPGDDSAGAAELALMWARAQWHADAPELELASAFEHAAERARRAGLPALFAEAAIGYAVGGESSVLLRIASFRPRALELVDEAWQRLQPIAAGTTTYRLAAARFWLGGETRPPEANKIAARVAVQYAPEGLDVAEQLWLLGLRAVAEPERERAHCEEIYARVAHGGIAAHRSIEIMPVLMAGHLRRGELDGWERAASEIARLAGLLRLPERAGARLSIYTGLPLVVPVTRAVIAGELGGALSLFWSAAERVQRLGLARTIEGDHNALHILLQIHGYLGRCAELEPFIAAFDTRGFWFVELMRAQLALERGDRATAERHFATLRASQFRPMIEGRATPVKPETLLRLADVCNEIGTRDDAALLYEALRPWATWIVHDGTLICWGSSERALGSLALQLERWDAAEHHFEAALARNGQLGHRPELARTRWDFARLRRAQGREAEAQTLNAAAERDAAAMGIRLGANVMKT